MSTSIQFWCFLLLLGSVTSCAPYRADQLVGEWTGATVLEEGKPLAIDSKEIHFSFKDRDSYAFHSTINYQESGTYYLDGRLLYTIDTLNKASTEKSVEIMLLTRDSLHIRMMDDGKERLLKLAKNK